MVTVAFRIPEEMKKKMERCDINWSEYVRNAILEALKSEKKRELIQKVQKLTAKQYNPPKGTAASIIREIREHE